MMTQSTPFIAILTALFINTLSYCFAENVYCVTPMHEQQLFAVGLLASASQVWLSSKSIP